MALFSFIAGVLVGVAASCVALPLWRSASTLAASARVGGRMRYVLAGAFVASFALAAGIIYLAIGSRHSLERPAMNAAASSGTAATGATTGGSGAAKSMDAEVASLEARLARDGGTPGDWSLLAQAYDFLGRPDDAKRARAKAGNPASGPAVWQMGASALTAAAAAADMRTTTGPSAGRAGAAPSGVAPSGGAPSAAVSTTDLERRVAANPRDAQSWLALADQRRGQRDYAGARAAYVKLVELRAMSAQSWADYADVLGSLAGGSLSGEAARAIDSALALDARD